MQLTVDTRNATAFELNALAEFVQKLASVAPERIFALASLGEAPLTAAERPGSVNTDSAVAQASTEQHLQSIEAGNAPALPAGGAPALPTAAGPAPEVPPAPGGMSGAAAPASTAPTDVPAVPTSGPAAGASTNAAAVSDKKLDKAGTPWDARIHTSNQAVIGDGTWRKKPGVDPALYAQVMAELTAASASAAQAITTTPSTVPPVPETAPALLTGNDVLKRAMEIQMADAAKSAPLFQAIQGAGIVGGPMGLPGTTDPALLQAALDAINAVGAQ